MNTINNFPKEYFDKLKQTIEAIDHDAVKAVTNLLFEAYNNNRQVFILGNGGSASTASHFACDLGKGTLANVYNMQEKRFRVISLTDNVATLMAYGNDLSFEDIFVQQLNNLIQKEDIVIGISASGNSPNIIKAIEYSKKCGAKSIGLLGFHTGGELARITDYKIIVPDDHYGRVEDLHLILCHLISDGLSKLKNTEKHQSI